MKKIGFVCYQYQWDHFLKLHADSASDVSFIPIIVTYELISRRNGSTLINELFTLNNLLKTEKCNLVVTITPKLGLLVSILKLFGKFKQIHWFTGQIWANKAGLAYYIYKGVDRLTYLLSDLTLCDSKSQLEYLIRQSVVSRNKCLVPHHGSICGFDESLLTIQFPKFDKDILTLGVVGRVCHEKGAVDAILELKDLLNEGLIKLTFIGPIDDDTNFKNSFSNQIAITKNITYQGEILNKVELFNSFDILLQPSYREGFSNVVLEAQAAGRPVICRNIYGLKSTYSIGFTGFEFEQNELEELVRNILKNRNLLSEKSINARNFAIQHFKQNDVLKYINQIYLGELNRNSF
jgi:glycosyltransferase involved in cell wall biosynthesis